MTIPQIRPYPMPSAEDLPSNVARWRIQPGRAALLVHDLQNFFVDRFPAGQEPVTTLLAHVRALCSAARTAGVPVFYSAQPGAMSQHQRGRLVDFWGAGMDGDPRSRRIVAAVAPLPGDEVVTKWRYSAFHGTDLGARLARHGRDQLIVCGVFAHVGCLMTACDAFSRDLETFLVTDAVADFNAAHHRDALVYAAGRCAVILDTARATTQLTVDRESPRERRAVPVS
jgi:bifunctional isochorismate lyase/aryl carrier protein